MVLIFGVFFHLILLKFLLKLLRTDFLLLPDVLQLLDLLRGLADFGVLDHFQRVYRYLVICDFLQSNQRLQVINRVRELVLHLLELLVLIVLLELHFVHELFLLAKLFTVQPGFR